MYSSSLLNTDYNFDTAAEAVQKAVQTVTLNLWAATLLVFLQNNVEFCHFL